MDPGNGSGFGLTDFHVSKLRDLFQVPDFEITAFPILINLFEPITFQGVNVFYTEITVSQHSFNDKIVAVAEVDHSVSFSNAKYIQGKAAHV